MTQSTRPNRPYLLCLAAVLLLAALPALKAAPAKYAIAAQPVDTALELFIKQSGAKVLFVHDEVAGVSANAVNGEYEPADALRLMLKGTPLTFKERNAGSFVVKKTMTGSVEGTLLPPPSAHGKSVQGIAVTVVETGQMTATDRFGRFTFPSLAPGTYNLVATGDGYSRLRIEDVAVQPDHALTLSPQAMAYVVRGGEVQMMEEVVVHANKDIETMNPYVVTDKKQPQSSHRISQI